MLLSSLKYTSKSFVTPRTTNFNVAIRNTTVTKNPFVLDFDEQRATRLPLSVPLKNVPTATEPVILSPPEFKFTTLSNGIKVISVNLKHQQRASSMGLFINAGPRNETPDNSGASFFLKRLAFKGSKNVSALQFVRSVELAWASYEIGVGREQMSYVSELPAKEIWEMVGILRESLEPSLIEYKIDEEIEALENDIRQFESDPKAVLLELIHQEAFRNKGLGQSLYTPAYNAHNLDSSKLTEFVESNFIAENTTVIVSGINPGGHDEFVKLVEKHFNDVRQGTKSTPPSPYQGGESRIAGDFETHLALGFEGAAAGTKESHALNILKYVLGNGKRYEPIPTLGGGYSGRLNRKVVEPNSFVQEASAFNFGYSDAGVFGVLGIAHRGNVPKLVDSLVAQLKGLSNISDEEIARAKAIYKGSIFFGTETRNSIMDFLAKQSFSSKVEFPSDLATAIDSVSAADVVAAAKRALKSSPTLVVLGDISNTPTIDKIRAALQ